MRDAITAAWRSSVEGIVECGLRLMAAKEDLPHGSFEAMIEDRLPFASSTARRLMAIVPWYEIKSFTCERFTPLRG